jgi:hypothetical protein
VSVDIVATLAAPVLAWAGLPGAPDRREVIGSLVSDIAGNRLGNPP